MDISSLLSTDLGNLNDFKEWSFFPVVQYYLHFSKI